MLLQLEYVDHHIVSGMSHHLHEGDEKLSIINPDFGDGPFGAESFHLEHKRLNALKRLGMHHPWTWGKTTFR
jgi:hypothetical protein